MDWLLFGLGLAFAFGGFLALLTALYHRRRIRQLTRPSSRIAEAPPGQVTLAGRVVADETLVSPVSEQPCVYMHVTMRPTTPRVSIEPRYGGRGHRRARVERDPSYDLDIERRIDHFWLEDDSGRVRVAIEGADFSLALDRSVRSSVLGPSDPGSERILRQFGARTASGGSRGNFLIQEAILEPGDTVLVTGKLCSDGSGALLVAGDQDEPVSITDRSATEATRSARSSARWAWAAFAACVLVAGCLVVLSFLASTPPPQPSGPAGPAGRW